MRSKLARIAVVNNEALRRHFHDLTQAVLAPFVRREAGEDVDEKKRAMEPLPIKLQTAAR